jgi:prepilin-type N-terminal cleavage/methylation domain-containing protein
MRRATEEIKAGDQSGMTLLEVMVSIIVLGVVLVGLGQGLVYGIKINNENKMRVSTLNMCKHITENIKTEISQSQSIFDATPQSNSTYYVDNEGNKTYSGAGANKVASFTSSSAYRVNVVVSNTGLTKTTAGVTNVLVKVLGISVVDIQNRDKVGRDVRMSVEIIRPNS